MGGPGEPVSPLSFRGFRLHTTWTQPPGGELIHHIAFPHLLGEGQKIAIDLQPPAMDHWNITSDRILPWMLEESQQQRAAKRVAQTQENRFEGAKASPTEVPTPEEPPKLEAQGSGKELPTKTAPDREQVLEATQGILECFHTLHLQTMHEMGGVREVDRSLTRTLLAEFGRLQLVVGEDFA